MNRFRIWANRVIEDLRDALGRVCSQCGATEDLQFDCIENRGDKHHRWETNRRAVFYRRELKAGNLTLLCQRCHSIKSKAEQFTCEDE